MASRNPKAILRERERERSSKIEAVEKEEVANYLMLEMSIAWAS